MIQLPDTFLVNSISMKSFPFCDNRMHTHNGETFKRCATKKRMRKNSSKVNLARLRLIKNQTPCFFSTSHLINYKINSITKSNGENTYIQRAPPLHQPVPQGLQQVFRISHHQRLNVFRSHFFPIFAKAHLDFRVHVEIHENLVWPPNASNIPEKFHVSCVSSILPSTFQKLTTNSRVVSRAGGGGGWSPMYLDRL